ncbi:MAG TPA: hypothetical protein ENJ11_00130 [Gammaproteobacteria bacterium]|nr:hypothetical protein [Gammaproteobacteria bacterium]
MEKIDELLDDLHRLQAQVEEEVEGLLEQKRKQFHYTLHQGKVSFASEVRKLHKAQRINVLAYLMRARPAHLLTAPIIYSVILPIALMDIMVSLYQSVCFRAYGIPLVRRSDYIIIDRHKLSYLNAIEKFNCVYCGYGNGVIEYAREITARTEQYWCPIKHARRSRSAHELINNFVDYGDAETYHRELEKIREGIRHIE